MVPVETGCILHRYLVQDDVSTKQKMKEDKKKMEEARLRAAQKGPMGREMKQKLSAFCA